MDQLPDEQPAPTRSADYEAVTSWVGTDPVEVFRGSEIDSALVRGVLVDADIPAAVWSSGHEGVYGHAFATAAFPHRVMVHKDDAAEARAIMAELDREPGR